MYSVCNWRRKSSIFGAGALPDPGVLYLVISV